MDKKTLLELLDTYILKKSSPIEFETPEITQYGVVLYPKDMEAHKALSDIISGINIMFEKVDELEKENDILVKRINEMITEDDDDQG